MEASSTRQSAAKREANLLLNAVIARVASVHGIGFDDALKPGALHRLAAELVDKYRPYPQPGDLPDETHLMSLDPRQAVTVINTDERKEVYLTRSWYLTDVKWANLKLRRISEACQLCRQDAESERLRIAPVLQAIPPGWMPQYVETMSSVPGRPGLAAYGTPDFVLFLAASDSSG